jgi:3-isopropylmalate/(R)-2-methylmalate dehydratase small subunit
MEPFTKLTAVAAPFDLANIDTDKIIPARFLRKLRNTEAGYGPWLFYDLCFDADGKERPEFVLNQTPWRNSGIIVAGPNFGCGDSARGTLCRAAQAVAGTARRFHWHRPGVANHHRP